MPKVVFTEVEKAFLEVLDEHRPLPLGKAFDIVNQEFAPQSLDTLRRVTTGLIRTGYVKRGSGLAPIVSLTEKGTRLVTNDFEEELGNIPGPDLDEEDALIHVQEGPRRRAESLRAE